jgi:molecular chaperone DnaK
LNKLKDAHKAQDVAAVDAAMAEMNTAWTAASEEIYKAQQAVCQPGPDAGANGNTGAANNETVTDAEFEEVK